MTCRFISRLSYMSSNSPSIKRRSLDRPASSQSHGNSFLRPSSVQYNYRRRRLSDNNFQRTSVTSQTSSLHTALSELAGDVEVVDMEDGALTNDRYSHNDYPGEFYGNKRSDGWNKISILLFIITIEFLI
jgi:hypothetical protein